MDVFEAIQARRSVRSYKPDMVPSEVLARLLEAARLAPSAHNAQPWRFIIVTDRAKRERIARGGRWAGFVSQAPVVIVGCGDPRSAYYIHDTCIALQNLVLQATAEGLGTCWVGSFDEEDLKGMLRIPGGLRVVALVSLGYPREETDLKRALLHKLKSRKRLEEIAYTEEYGRPLGEAIQPRCAKV